MQNICSHANIFSTMITIYQFSSSCSCLIRGQNIVDNEPYYLHAVCERPKMFNIISIVKHFWKRHYDSNDREQKPLLTLALTLGVNYETA